MKLVRILFLIFISGYYSKVLFQVINDQATYDNLKAFKVSSAITLVMFVATVVITFANYYGFVFN